MGTVIDRVDVARPRLRGRHSALHLAVAAAKDCLRHAGCEPHELDLVVNAGIYRDKNLGEPALAALIQDDIGANPEDPHGNDGHGNDAHGTFSFDVANGACGVLTALQIVDGFLRTGSVQRALVVTSDADPGHGMSENFLFSATGAALLCGWTDADYGLSDVSWANAGDTTDDVETSSATVGFDDGRNVLRFRQSPDADDRFAAVAAEAARSCLERQGVQLAEVDLIIAAPARPRYREALRTLLGLPAEKVCVADDHRVHTAALAAAFGQQSLRPGSQILFVAAGAGVVAGAALYRQPPAH